MVSTVVAYSLLFCRIKLSWKNLKKLDAFWKHVQWIDEMEIDLIVCNEKRKRVKGVQFQFQHRGVLIML